MCLDLVRITLQVLPETIHLMPSIDDSLTSTLNSITLRLRVPEL